MDNRTRKRIVVAVLIVVGLPIVTLAVAGAVLWQRYVTTEAIDRETAATEFARARGRFAGAPALLEYRGFDGAVRRDPSAPRHPIQTLHVLAYSPADGELRRADIPWAVVRVVTLNGRRPFTSLPSGGKGETDVTLEDLERHGPGLIVDTTGANVGPLAVSDALVGTEATGSRLLIWTE